MGARGAGEIFPRRALRGLQGLSAKPEALCVKIGGKHIGDISELSVKGAGAWFETVPEALNTQQNEIAGRILKEAGFEGMFSIELEGIRGEPEQTLEERQRRVERSVQHLRDVGLVG